MFWWYFDLSLRDFPGYLKHTLMSVFNFQGRANQQESLVIWWLSLLYTVSSTLLKTAFMLITGKVVGADGVLPLVLEGYPNLLNIAWGIMLVGFLWLFLAQLALNIRRIHDFGRSGWYIFAIIGYSSLILMAIMLILILPVLIFDGPKASAFFESTGVLLMFLALTVASYGLSYYFFVRPKSQGKNVYGERALYKH